MVRRGQQKKQSLKKAAKAITEKAESPQGTYVAPRRSACQHRQWVESADDAGTLQIQVNIWKHGGAVVDFVMILQGFGPSGWMDIERVDCCHGHCHLHPATGDGAPESIHQLDSVDDVKEAVDRASIELIARARIIRNMGEQTNES